MKTSIIRAIALLIAAGGVLFVAVFVAACWGVK
jgi:hypothetical protein